MFCYEKSIEHDFTTISELLIVNENFFHLRVLIRRLVKVKSSVEHLSIR